MSFRNVPARLEAEFADQYESINNGGRVVREKIRKWNLAMVHSRIGRVSSDSIFIVGGENKGVSIRPQADGVVIDIREGKVKGRFAELPMFDANIDITRGEHGEVTAVSAWCYGHDGEDVMGDKLFFESYRGDQRSSLSVATLAQCIKYAKSTIES